MPCFTRALAAAAAAAAAAADMDNFAFGAAAAGFVVAGKRAVETAGVLSGPLGRNPACGRGITRLTSF